jgi:hypothetical protein
VKQLDCLGCRLGDEDFVPGRVDVAELFPDGGVFSAQQDSPSLPFVEVNPLLLWLLFERSRQEIGKGSHRVRGSRGGSGRLVIGRRSGQSRFFLWRRHYGDRLPATRTEHVEGVGRQSAGVKGESHSALWTCRVHLLCLR